MTALAARALPATAAQGWVADARYGPWLKFLLGLALVMTLTPDALDYTRLDLLNSMTSDDYGLVARVQWFPLFGIGALLVASRWRLAWALVQRMNPFLLLSLGWIFASILWSGYPDISLRRAIKIAGMGLVVFGFFLYDWTPMAPIRALRLSCAILIFASIVFVIVMPLHGVHQGYLEPNLKGAWRGVTTHKNALGILGALSAMLWAHAWASRDAPWTRCLAVLVATFVCLVGSRSTTGLVTAVFTGSLVAYLLAAPPWMRSLSFIGGAAAAVIGLLCTVFVFTGIPTPSEAIAAATGGVGKDAGFTGRDLIWGAVLEEVKKHPWIGTGYNAFWVSQDLSSPSADVIRTINFAPLQAHNGYLEILNELGVIGLFLLFGFLIYQFWQLARLYPLDRRVASFGIGYMVYDLLLNISEANFLRPTFAPSLVEWVVVIMTARTLLHHEWLAARPRGGAVSAGTAAVGGPR